MEGTYYVNRLFATVDMTDKTQIRIGHVGVVISYTGPKGDDVSGEDYKHGKLVKPGHRGVWERRCNRANTPSIRTRRKSSWCRPPTSNCAGSRTRRTTHMISTPTCRRSG